MNKKLILFSSSVVLLGLVFSLSLTMNNQNDEIMGYKNHYVFSAVEPEDVKKLATSIVNGKIIDKKQVIDYQDKETQEGKILQDFYAIPSQIYTVQTTDVIRGDSTPKTFEVKMRGGEIDGITWNSGHDDHSVGDELILILDKKESNDFYQPVSEFFGVYKIEGTMAKNPDREYAEQILLEKLQ